MKIKFIAAPLVAGALMVPATLSTPRGSGCRSDYSRRVK